MKVGMYYNNTDVRVEECPKPSIGDTDILIKVMACGICGSDTMEWYRIKRAPLVLGHEMTGEIEEVGRNIKKFKPGDRVFSTHHVPCDSCRYCLAGHETACETFHKTNNFHPGGFSQYLKVSGQSVETGTFILPSSMTFEQGTFIEPLGTAVRCLETAKIGPSDCLLVLGSGVIGLLIIKLARAMGAGSIVATDIIDFRLEAAKKFGADHTVNAQKNVPEFIRSVNEGRLADKIIICNGALSSSLQALESIDRGGTIVFFAVPKPGENVAVDFNPYWRNDIGFKTSYGAAPANIANAIELIQSGRVLVDDMITHLIPLSRISDGFKIASHGKDSLKVIIQPN